MNENLAKNIGLRGVTVADSKISKVEGDLGKLIYRGYAIRDLAKSASFEEVVYLLLMGCLPTEEHLAETKEQMAKARQLPDAIIDMLKLRRKEAHPMDVLQGAVSALSDHDPDLNETDREALVRMSLRLVARTSMVVAAWYHIRQRREPVSVEETLSCAGAFLKALWGRTPTQDETRLMDILLVIHADHTFNASTFAVREVASTRAHLYASVAAGVGALSGALHGGANARVMEMLQEIGDPDNVEGWVRTRIAEGKRVMGLGHAVYKVEDPRAAVLREIAEKTLAGRPEEKWFRLSLEVERLARRFLIELKGLDLYPNVDFYSGGVLHALGLPPEFFPAFFASSRVSGWCAHYIEEYLAEAQPKPTIYRPRAYYTGRYCGPQGCSFVPLEARGHGCTCGVPSEACTEQDAVEEAESATAQG